MQQKDKNTNPLSGYGVSDKEFEFYKNVYKAEQRAFWKGVLTVFLITFVICSLVAIVMIVK